MNEQRPDNATEFYIYGIIPYDRINGSYNLILKDNEDIGKMAALAIGSPEAQSIAIFLEGPDMDRPLTHDLLCNILLERGIDVQYVVIDSSDGGVFFSMIMFSDGISMDARPSDAISVAIRLGSPIFIHNDIVEELAFEVSGVKGMPEKNDQIKKDPPKEKQDKQKKTKKTLDDLQNELNEAIEKEDYELAAKLRDRINKKI